MCCRYCGYHPDYKLHDSRFWQHGIYRRNNMLLVCTSPVWFFGEFMTCVILGTSLFLLAVYPKNYEVSWHRLMTMLQGLHLHCHAFMILYAWCVYCCMHHLILMMHVDRFCTSQFTYFNYPSVVFHFLAPPIIFGGVPNMSWQIENGHTEMSSSTSGLRTGSPILS